MRTACLPERVYGGVFEGEVRSHVESRAVALAWGSVISRSEIGVIFEMDG